MAATNPEPYFGPLGQRGAGDVLPSHIGGISDSRRYSLAAHFPIETKPERGVALQCTRCRSNNVSRSRRRMFERYLLFIFRMLPYRCCACRKRFYGAAE